MAPNTRAVWKRPIVIVIAITFVNAGVAFAQSPAAAPSRAPIPARVAAEARQLVATATASTLDPALPPVPFVDWLFTAAGQKPPHESQIYWSMRRCWDVLRNISPGGNDLCVDGAFRLSPRQSVRVIVAAARQVDANDEEAWEAIPLVVRRVYIDLFAVDRVVDSLDVAALGELPLRLQAAQAAAELWPEVDLDATVRASESSPKAGATVLFTIDLVNRGSRAAERAVVTVRIQREGGSEIVKTWLQDLGAGQTSRVEIPASLPMGNAVATVAIRPPQGPETFRGAEGWRAPAVAIVGDLPRPRQ